VGKHSQHFDAESPPPPPPIPSSNIQHAKSTLFRACPIKLLLCNRAACCGFSSSHIAPQSLSTVSGYWAGSVQKLRLHLETPPVGAATTYHWPPAARVVAEYAYVQYVAAHPNQIREIRKSLLGWHHLPTNSQLHLPTNSQLHLPTNSQLHHLPTNSQLHLPTNSQPAPLAN
jgi:hypothetical protein